MPWPWKALAGRAARVIALGVGVPVVLLAIVARFFGDRLVFFPDRYPTARWEAARAMSPVPLQDVFLTAADGVKVHGWYAKPERARVTFLVLHGNAGNIADRVHYVLALHDLPAAVFLLDYRGYGRSEGAPDEAGVYADAQAAYRWLVGQGVPANRIILYGESLGAAVAVDLAARVPLGGLILQCGFTSVADMARQVVPFLPLGGLMKSRFDAAAKIASVRAPKLHFHGRADEVVPFHLGRRLFEAAAQPKRWVEYPEMTHNEWPGRREQEWRAEIVKFVEGGLGSPAPPDPVRP